jgi:hypothetical protein
MRKFIIIAGIALLLMQLYSIAYGAELVGMISRMDGNVGVLSIPKHKGAEPGMILYVYRRARCVGRAEISEAGPYYSKIMALPECKGLMVGDAVLSTPLTHVCPGRCMDKPLPCYGKNVKPSFTLRQTDGRALVAGRIDMQNLEQVRKDLNLKDMILLVQNIENAEEFYVPLASTGKLFLELPAGTYVIEHVHLQNYYGSPYNAWGIPIGIVPGFFMRHGGKVIPLSYKFTVPEKSDIVYIGTLKSSLDPKNLYDKSYKPLPVYASVADEYDTAMSDIASMGPFVRKIAKPGEWHLEARGEKSLMELVPAGPGALFQQRGDLQMAIKKYLDFINYYEAPYRAEAHNALAGIYWDKEEWESSFIHYQFAKALGYAVPEDRMKFLAPFRNLTKPQIE